MMDILVRLEGGSYCNIEVQRVGYSFPGQRSACYSADLLLRQYKTVRGRRKKQFSFRDVKGVYTIVLMERSLGGFHDFPGIYRHCFEAKSDTGLQLDLLQKYVFVPLDIFRESVHNHGMNSKLDAWLAFLSMDDPEIVAALITRYPEFRAMYSHIYDICVNVEKVMGMYSKELQMMDKNTVQYMVDQMSDEINSLKKENASVKEENASVKEENASMKEELASKDGELEDLKAQNEKLNRMIQEMKGTRG